MSLVLAASAVQLACVDEVRNERTASHDRDSALAHDLVLAGYDSAVIFPAGRYFGGPMTGATVTESPGDLADGASASTSTSTSTPADTPAPSAERKGGPPCSSPAAADQQRCLEGYLARSDVQLNRSYQALITQLRAEAGKRPGANDPPTVKRLRATQRNWIAYRNDECRKRAEARDGTIWAPDRARCFEEYTVLREREFDDALAKRKPVVAKPTPAKPKVTKPTKRTKAKRYKSGWG
jgi:uncharacterized protein YecT (DUF1311 family)